MKKWIVSRQWPVSRSCHPERSSHPVTLTCHPERSEGSAVRRTAHKAWAVAFLAAVLLLTMAQADNNKRFTDLGHRMMCTCSCNQVLLECNHVGCTASDTMRAELKAGLDKGLSDQQVLDLFVQKYGAIVLNAPTTHGFNLVAWIMPFAVLVLATWVVIVFVRKWQQRPVTVNDVPALQSQGVDVEALRQQAREETEV